MAVTVDNPPTVEGLSRFGLTTANALGLSAFYQKAFGCQVEIKHVSDAGFERLMNAQGGAVKITLALGSQTIELLEFDHPGRPYPKWSLASDLIFQHFAIVVSDMAQAYAQLCAIPRWMPISIGGPQELPQSSGCVTAFKFRDPEGHPLELLEFPKNNVPAIWQAPCASLCLGVDHSAIGVSDVGGSVKFYESFGFAVTSRSVNEGRAQQNLDGVQDVRVEVVALAINRIAPHLELLCYSSNVSPASARLRSNDVAATRTVLAGTAQRCITDPDGHRIVIA
jgi:catechol 2,3-dioxygenase-like lactoylglutathione lyase family enzyme